MTRRTTAAALAALLFAAPAGRGQPPPGADPAALRGDSPQTRKRLAEAEQKLAGGKAGEAVEDLQRVLDEAGDDFVTVDGRQYRPARWVVHQLLAALPPDALAAYQARVDEPARKLLDAAKRDRDPRPLWHLVDRYFVSRPAAEGLLLLGDLLFERGDFRTAELVWRRLLPDADADVPYPTPPADPAAVRARVALAAAFQGEPDRAAAEMAALKAKYPGAAGAFAGKTGPYADAVQAFLDRPPHPAPEPAGGGWPSFAGGPDRAGRAAGPIPRHWPTRPTWEKAVPVEPGAARGGGRVAPAAPPFGHPVIADGRVYLSDGNRVSAFDLLTGNPAAVAAAPRFALPAPRLAESPAAATLTAAGGRVYARLGRTPAAAPAGAKAGESALACYAPPANPGRFSPPVREVWRVPPPAADGKPPAAWEGAPLVAGGRMWAALARAEGGRVVHSVAAFDPADADRGPDRPAWVAEVCDSPSPPGAEARTRQELLTLAGRNVVLNSNAGAVVAVDAVTGRRAWGFQYPRAARRADANRGPDPAPAVAAGGRVFVAPADADRVYALDAETGKLLWESGPTEGAQILGVVRTRVVVTTTGPVRGVRALGVATGSHRGPDGWVQADGGGLLGYGRGLVTGAAVVWPTRAGLYFLDPDTGRPLADPLRTPPAAGRDSVFGNVAYADGVLVVVTPTHVWGYVAEGVPRPRPLPPDAPPRRVWEALIDAAERDLAAGNGTAARAALAAAAGENFPGSCRAWAAARLLLLAPPVADPAALPADVRAALAPGLRAEWLLTADGELLTLGELADRRTGRPPPPRGFPSAAPPTDRKPDDAPALGPDACVATAVRLPPASYPLRAIAGATPAPVHAFAASPGAVVAVPLDGSGKVTTRPFADVFTHAADVPGGFVAAGPFAVAVFPAGRAPAWAFRLPDTDPLPARPGEPAFRTGERPPAPHLSSFTLAGAWLLARAGDHHLVALDLTAGRVAWVLGAHGRPRFEPLVFPSAPRFEPQLYVAGRVVAAQLSDGRRWLIRGDTGRVWDGEGATFAGPVPLGSGAPTARAPWVLPPAEVDSNRVAFSDGPGLVRLVHLTTGRVKWGYEAGGESGLAGDPPQVHAWGDAVLVAVRRNTGVELDRVELGDGKSVWAGGPVFLPAARLDLSAADADPQRVYVPAGGKLLAIGLDDGKAAWAADLPAAGGGWVVRAGRKAVIAYPAEAVAADPPGAALGRAAASFRRAPLPWRLPWLAANVYDSWTDRTVPVLLFDPETGELLKRLTIPARGPGVTAWFAGEVAVVATGDRVVWLE